jgi:hypothetical protein
VTLFRSASIAVAGASGVKEEAEVEESAAAVEEAGPAQSTLGPALHIRNAMQPRLLMHARAHARDEQTVAQRERETEREAKRERERERDKERETKRERHSERDKKREAKREKQRERQWKWNSLVPALSHAHSQGTRTWPEFGVLGRCRTQGQPDLLHSAQNFLRCAPEQVSMSVLKQQRNSVSA